MRFLVSPVDYPGRLDTPIGFRVIIGPVTAQSSPDRLEEWTPSSQSR